MLSVSSRFVLKFPNVGGHHLKRHMSSVITLSDLDATEKFKQLNQKSVFYFTATWCPPCRQIKPIYEELSKKYENVKFAKIDVDDNPDASLEYSISAVPTFIFFDGESQVNHFAGADPSKLESMVQDLEGR